MSLTPDPRAARSRAALLDAARQLVDARAIGSIAITDVCTLAGVSRPTFYQHFGDIAADRLLAFVERSGAADPELIKPRVRLLAAGAAWLVMEQLGDRRDPDGLDSAASRIAQQLT